MDSPPTFGAFFRARRKALGLNLREFCRRHGFDPGNVSRLERGLASPPQSREGLESYARALQMEPDTEDWARFLDLAAIATGRLPPQLLDSPRTTTQLPAMLQRLRNEGRRHPNWVTARHLEAWAGTLHAQATLPQLVRRLVAATGKGVEYPAFPSGEQIQRPGWDGITQAAGPDAFVPAGTSAWEMGTGDDPRKKAQEDFRKRTRNPRGLDTRQTTFVFVTPRQFRDKQEWCQARNRSRSWKEVRVYDAADLEAWLERAPAVDAWLASLLALRPPGVTTLDEHWANLQAVTAPSLQPQVFLTSREQEAQKLADWLAGPLGVLTVEARSPAEAVDFLAACWQTTSDPDRLAARALIVEDRDAWRALTGTSDGELLLIAAPGLALEPELVAEAVRRGHRVLLPSTEPPRDSTSHLVLPRPYRYDLAKSLEQSGFDEERAEWAARESGGSLAVLKRLLARLPGTTRPPWAAPENAPALIPLLLAGHWTATSDADRAALDQFSGRPYADLAQALARWSRPPDPLLLQALSHVRLVSRDDSWHLLAPFITADHLDRFEKVALAVLGEDDPAYDLPPRDRWLAALHHKVPRHSPDLRTGIAETLALLAARPDRLTASSRLGLEARIDRVVHRLLHGQDPHGQDWRRWASLSRDLPLLAEASPEAFLSALEHDLKRKDPACVQLFEQKEDFPVSRSPHTGLLWALEVLAWDRFFLPRVALALAALDECDRGGNLGNRPSQCFERIFLPWLPQTTATAVERARILKTVMQRKPEAGWRLLKLLLPNVTGATLHTCRPMWRDWALGWSRASGGDCWEQIDACARLLIENRGNSPARWKDLVEKLDKMSEPARKDLLRQWSATDVANLPADLRTVVADTLRQKIGRYRRYPAPRQTLPEKTLAELERIQELLEPQDVVIRSLWLFGEYWKTSRMLGDREDRLAQLRVEALREILDGRGWEGIMTLARAAESPGDVGYALGSGRFAYEANVLPALLATENQVLARFAWGFVQGRSCKEGGWHWINQLDTEKWSVEDLGRLLVLLPPGKGVWDFAASKGPEVTDYYWTHLPRVPFGGEEDCAFAVSRLLDYRRPFTALDLLTRAVHQAAAPTALLLDALNLAHELELIGTIEEKRKAAEYDIPLLIGELQKRLNAGDTAVDRDSLAKLEWTYLGSLDGHPVSPVTLHAILRDQPGAFVDLLALAFRPKNEKSDSSLDISEEDKARSRNAYELLYSWTSLPGSNEAGVDEKLLMDWVRNARALARERGLLEDCDYKLGEHLACDEERSGDAWPSDPVKDALEETDTPEVYEGFEMGILDRRGAYIKWPNEGGNQERALAKKYHQFAEAANAEWPGVARVLRNVAKHYEEQAGREDARVMLNE